MREEFHTEDLPAAELGEALSRLGKDGWLIVNCWPSTGGTVTCIFRRPLVFFCTRTKRYEPVRLPAQLTLDVALARCIDEPRREFRDKKTGETKVADYHAIRVAKLGEEFGLEEADMVDLLKQTGLKEYPEGSGRFSAIVGNHSVWIYRKTAKEPWDLYAKPRSETKVSKPTEKSAPDPETPAISGTPEAGSAAAFSVADAIALCMAQAPTKRGLDHGIRLSQAAKEQGVDIEDAIKALREIGLPTAYPDSKEKCYVDWQGKQVALREWREGIWYLNVKS